MKFQWGKQKGGHGFWLKFSGGINFGWNYGLSNFLSRLGLFFNSLTLVSEIKRLSIFHLNSAYFISENMRYGFVCVPVALRHGLNSKNWLVEHFSNLRGIENLVSFDSLWFDVYLLLLVKVTLVHGCFSRFLNCTNGTKSRKASQLDYDSKASLMNWQKYNFANAIHKGKILLLLVTIVSNTIIVASRRVLVPFELYWRPKKYVPKCYLNIFFSIFYVEAKWSSLRILRKKYLFKRHKYALKRP